MNQRFLNDIFSGRSFLCLEDKEGSLFIGSHKCIKQSHNNFECKNCQLRIQIDDYNIKFFPHENMGEYMTCKQMYVKDILE